MLKKFTTLWFQGTKRSWCRYFCVVNLRGSNFMPYACKPKDTFTNIGFFLWLIVLRDVRNVCRSILFKNIFAILLILWLLLEKLKIMKTILLDFINNSSIPKYMIPFVLFFNVCEQIYTIFFSLPMSGNAIFECM